MTGSRDLSPQEREIVDQIGRRAKEIIVLLSNPQITDTLANKLALEAGANYAVVNSILRKHDRLRPG